MGESSENHPYKEWLRNSGSLAEVLKTSDPGVLSNSLKAITWIYFICPEGRRRILQWGLQTSKPSPKHSNDTSCLTAKHMCCEAEAAPAAAS